MVQLGPRLRPGGRVEPIYEDPVGSAWRLLAGAVMALRSVAGAHQVHTPPGETELVLGLLRVLPRTTEALMSQAPERVAVQAAEAVCREASRFPEDHSLRLNVEWEGEVKWDGGTEAARGDRDDAALVLIGEGIRRIEEAWRQGDLAEARSIADIYHSIPLQLTRPEGMMTYGADALETSVLRATTTDLNNWEWTKELLEKSGISWEEAVANGAAHTQLRVHWGHLEHEGRRNPEAETKVAGLLNQCDGYPLLTRYRRSLPWILERAYELNPEVAEIAATLLADNDGETLKSARERAEALCYRSSE